MNKKPQADNQNVPASEDTSVSITLTGNDGDEGGDQQLLFILTSLPVPGFLSVGGIAITQAELPKTLPGNSVTYVPPPEASFSTTFDFRVRDDGGTADGGVDSSDTARVTVNVAAVNDIPTLNAVANVSVDEKSPVSFGLHATDIDVVEGIADILRYSIISGELNGMTLDAGSGLFDWTPSESQDGTYVVVFGVSDNHGGSAEQTATITVREINAPPVLANPGNQNVVETQVLEFSLAGLDNDVIEGIRDPLKFQIDLGLQTGMDLNETTGRFSWTPTVTQAGVYFLTFHVTDSQGEVDEESIQITVQNSNQAPTAISLAAVTLKENLSGAPVGTLSATDPDVGQTHIFSTADSRFEINGNSLKLKDDQFVTGQSIAVNITATDSGSPPESILRTLLIDVLVNSRAWRNVALPFDTNNDGTVVPLDALRIINELNDPKIIGPGGKLPDSRFIGSTLPYYDTNGDGFCTPVGDVLPIFNFLNSRSAEGESEIFVGPLVDQRRDKKSGSRGALARRQVALQGSMAESFDWESEVNALLDDIAEDVACANPAGLSGF